MLHQFFWQRCWLYCSYWLLVRGALSGLKNICWVLLSCIKDLLDSIEIYLDSLKVSYMFKSCDSVFMEHLSEYIILNHSAVNQALEYFQCDLLHSNLQAFLLYQALNNALDFICELHYILGHWYHAHF